MNKAASRYLIVNADDFGICESISRGIIFGHQHGAISSTTAITNGAFFEQGAELIKDYPDLGVGVHLNLDEEKPALPPAQIPSIVNESGHFYSRWEIITRILREKSSLDDIKAEWTAQIERCLDAGIKPSHLDSHGHLHHLPDLQGLVGELASAFDIRNLRRTTVNLRSLAKNPTSLVKATLLWGCGWLFDRKDQLAGLNHVRSIGLEESGRVSYLDLIRNIRSLPKGVTEMMLHPGFSGEDNNRYREWGYRWEAELQAVIDDRVPCELERQNVQLINHRQVSGV